MSAVLETARAEFPGNAGRGPAMALGAALLLWFTLWLALPLHFDGHVPVDNLEQLSWAQHPAWGYAKHPPFPTWILWCFERLFSAGAALTYCLGALQVGILLWMTWLLARDSLPKVVSWFAPVMVACISYYTVRMHFYNHNTALMVAYAVALLALWRAVTQGGRRWWLLLGVAWGVGMLSKYQMALLIGCNVAFLWSVRGLGSRRLLRGFALACVVAAGLCTPHLVWLVQNHFPTFGYASTKLAAHLGVFDRLYDVLSFLSHQCLRLAPLMILLGILAWRMRVPGTLPGETSGEDADMIAARFWRIHAWGPIVGITMLGLLLGAAVENHWGMASLWAISCWILTTARGRRWATAPLREVLWFALPVQALMVMGYLLGK